MTLEFIWLLLIKKRLFVVFFYFWLFFKKFVNIKDFIDFSCMYIVYRKSFFSFFLFWTFFFALLCRDRYLLMSWVFFQFFFFFFQLKKLNLYAIKEKLQVLMLDAAVLLLHTASADVVILQLYPYLLGLYPLLLQH